MEKDVEGAQCFKAAFDEFIGIEMNKINGLNE